MNEALQVTTFYEGYGSKVMKVDGFSDSDLDDLRRMDYRDMIQQVLEALDKCNGGMGTQWKAGYGVFSAYMNGQYPKSIFVEIGKSCD